MSELDHELEHELEVFTKGARIVAELELVDAERPSFDALWSQLESRGDGDVDEVDPELFAWVDAARGQARADLEGSGVRPIPVLPGLIEASPVTSERVGLWWGLGLVAAALLLFWGGSWVIFASQDSADVRTQQAPMHAPERELREDAMTKGDENAEAGPQLAPESEPAQDSAPMEVPEPDAHEESVAPKSKSKRAPRKSKSARLRDLDAEAQRLWKAGDLAGAQAIFEQIVDQGARMNAAELAYGDLLTLARQRGETSLESALWRAYLRRFPKGRHADDARAGLCRRTRGARSSECWGLYLDEFPKGAHRAQAQKYLAEHSFDELGNPQ